MRLNFRQQRRVENSTFIPAFNSDTGFVAAGEACVRLRSSRKSWVLGLPETPSRMISRLLRSRTQASPAATRRV